MPARPTDYEVYLRVPELLSLQKPAEKLACSDELLFQVVHQSAELWMKVVDHEMRRIGQLLDNDVLGEAQALLHRVHGAQCMLAEGLELLYTLSPADYMLIRDVLGRGSGQESPGFRRMLAIASELWPHFAGLLTRHEISLLDMYRQPRRYPDVYA